MDHGGKCGCTNNSHDRRLVEFCCERFSQLGVIDRYSEGCDVYRIDQDTDITSPKTQSMAHRALCTHNACAWISVPCTGESKWNQFNWEHRPETREGIQAHIDQFLWFFDIIVKILRGVRRNGYETLIMMELPTGCAYWNYDCVQRFFWRNLVCGRATFTGVHLG